MPREPRIPTEEDLRAAGITRTKPDPKRPDVRPLEAPPPGPPPPPPPPPPPNFDPDPGGG